MPVHLAHGSRLDGNQGSGEALRDRERLWVKNFDGAAWYAVGLRIISKISFAFKNRAVAYLLLGPVEAVGALLGDQTSRTRLVLLLDVRWRRSTRENPQLIRRGFLECVKGSTEVLCNNGLGSPLDELGEEERVLLAKGAIVKNTDFKVSI